MNYRIVKKNTQTHTHIHKLTHIHLHITYTMNNWHLRQLRWYCCNRIATLKLLIQLIFCTQKFHCCFRFGSESSRYYYDPSKYFPLVSSVVPPCQLSLVIARYKISPSCICTTKSSKEECLILFIFFLFMEN